MLGRAECGDAVFNREFVDFLRLRQPAPTNPKRGAAIKRVDRIHAWRDGAAAGHVALPIPAKAQFEIQTGRDSKAIGGISAEVVADGVQLSLTIAIVGTRVLQVNTPFDEMTTRLQQLVGLTQSRIILSLPLMAQQLPAILSLQEI